MSAPTVRCDHHPDDFILRESFDSEVDRFRFLISVYELRLSRLSTTIEQIEDLGEKYELETERKYEAEDLSKLKEQLGTLESKYEREIVKGNVEDEQEDKYPSLKRWGIFVKDGMATVDCSWTRPTQEEAWVSNSTEGPTIQAEAPLVKSPGKENPSKRKNVTFARGANGSLLAGGNNRIVK